LSSLLFTLARSRLGRSLVGFLFTHMTFALPINRLHETPTLVAFHHPRPSYPVHILLVPKRPITNLMALTPADQDFMTDLIQTVQSLVQEFALEGVGYRLITNGGPYQDIPHLHFHLVSENKT
jgi:histidine triad (HIT) family protein